ncbi:EpsG family protein [Aliamphritea ceti]|uniref:EpsG family protein n=1 Tax=Aliamphritea ceti TaxID=1524258 RepID=UPI0021C4C4BB|nr:EpsG family protein [Aliamphritea ceti]
MLNSEYFLAIVFIGLILILVKRSGGVVLFVVAIMLAVRSNEDEYSRLVQQYPPFSDGVYSFFHQFGTFGEKGPYMWAINTFVNEFSLPERSVLFITTAVTWICIFILLKKLDVPRNWVLLLLFANSIFITSMSGLRMNLSTAIVLLSAVRLYSGSKVGGWWGLVAAVAVHYVAILGLVAVVLRRCFTNWPVFFLLFFFTLSLTGLPAWVLENFTTGIVESYLRSNYASALEGVDYLRFVYGFFLVLAVWMRREFIFSQFGFSRLFFDLYVFGLSVGFLLRDFGIFSYRSLAVFSPLEAILLVYLIMALRGKGGVSSLLVFGFSLFFGYVNFVVLDRLQPYGIW